MAYLFAAFLILWAVTFGYIFSISARQKRLQQELEALQEKEQDGA
jgi:CcmD family protein